MKEGGVPPGWDYNPAEWSQRIPIAALAMVGLLQRGGARRGEIACQQQAAVGPVHAFVHHQQGDAWAAQQAVEPMPPPEPPPEMPPPEVIR